VEWSASRRWVALIALILTLLAIMCLWGTQTGKDVFGWMGDCRPSAVVGLGNLDGRAGLLISQHR
jgi:hypothetical protein